MIAFIIYLRCLAAMLITNAHYIGIYPTDLIANGGLLGDIIFFCVSGYCLTNLQTGFFKWYGKRLTRILPSVFFVIAVYWILGQYDFSIYASGTEATLLYQALTAVGITYPKWLSWFLYPTDYHFVASILVLYIPYYFILKSEVLRKHIPVVMSVIAAIGVAIYIFAYDKSFYHIDTVREPFIRFLFLESMLMGAWFKLNDAKLRNAGKPILYAAGTAILFAAYFASKVLLGRVSGIAQLQIVNWVIICALLYFVVRLFSSMDKHFEKMPKPVSSTVNFVADITLEIYLVQYVLIKFVRQCNIFFPLNWIVLTAMIVAAAFAVHMLIKFATKALENGIQKLKNNADKING